MKLKAFVSLIALAGFAGCDSWLTKPSMYNTVPVIATRRDGTPVAGVGLELYTGQRPMGYGVTDSTGRFVFTRVPQGLYGVVTTSTPAGFDLPENLLGGPATNVANALHVAFDSVPEVHFVFLKKGPGTVTMRVVSDAGSPMAGLATELYSASGTIAKATTDALGRATFNNVPYGQYGVLVVRPHLYRDFIVPDDSAISHRDGLVVEQGSRDSVNIAIAKCAGAVSATVVDQFGAPVPGSTLTLFSSTAQLGLKQTGADGKVVFTDLACTVSMGIHVNPAANYLVSEGRGWSFFDGITMKNGQTTQVAFVVIRQ